MASTESDSSFSDSVGLCARCVYGKCVGHPRKGNAYWRCEKSAHDPKFPKYPGLPVIECSGFETASGN